MSILTSLKSLFQKPKTTYVVIYDTEEQGSDNEHYYGYFSSKEEAAEMFACFHQGQELSNIKLCQVLENWD